MVIPSVHFKQKSEVSAQKLSSQRLQRLFPILHEKGSSYSRTAIRLKQTDYANFQKQKKECTLYEYLKKKKFRKRQTWNTLFSFLHDVKSSKFTSETTEKLYRNGLAGIVTLQQSRFFSGIKNLYSRFTINGIIAVLRFFLFMSNLAKQQIFSRNVSNVTQLIGSMGDMDRTSVFFSYSRPPRPRSQINMTDRGLERYIVF